METASTRANQGAISRLVNSVVVPRPIAWVTSQGADGVNNLSPFSYFQVVSVDPVMVMISFNDDKNTYLNIRETGQFVINSVTASNLDMAVMSSADVDQSIDEAASLGVKLAPSMSVTVPRIAMSPTALECVLHSTTHVGTGRIVFATVTHVYIDDDILDEHARLDPARFAPAGRMGSNYYTIADSWRSIDRPTLDQFDALTRPPAETGFLDHPER